MNFEPLKSFTSPTEWVVARLNYAEPLEVFLVKSVKPYVNSIVQAGIVDRYFWQRGTTGGAHIIVAMRGNAQTLSELVLPNLGEHFLRYVGDKPSRRAVDRVDFEPNNSIQTQEYKPNTEGVGGDIGQPIFERFEQASSDAVLTFLSVKHDNWTSIETAAIAIQMQLGFLDSAGLDTADAAQFCEFYLTHYADEHFSPQLFEYIFKRHEEGLFSYHKKTWSALKTGDLFEEKYFNRWLEQCYLATEDIRLTFRTRRLQTEPRFSAIWEIYAEFVKATNKRLGLTGKHESLVFYVMMRALEQLCPIKKVAS
ncbi:MAG: lantibiotic dehydratase C-terminal domain-containing protein [Saprospiraceae bacterium]|nr:lantibiotic dehydratase C-terminal domain-containing protein [Saprospiraceae bacterium]